MGSRSKGDTRERPQPICRPRQSPSSPIAIAGPAHTYTRTHTHTHTHTQTHTHTHTHTQPSPLARNTPQNLCVAVCGLCMATLAALSAGDFKALITSQPGLSSAANLCQHPLGLWALFKGDGRKR